MQRISSTIGDVPLRDVDPLGRRGRGTTRACASQTNLNEEKAAKTKLNALALRKASTKASSALRPLLSTFSGSALSRSRYRIQVGRADRSFRLANHAATDALGMLAFAGAPSAHRRSRAG